MKQNIVLFIDLILNINFAFNYRKKYLLENMSSMKLHFLKEESFKYGEHDPINVRATCLVYNFL